MNSKAGLVLSGGGARASYQVGALRALSEILPHSSNPFPIISGTSAGAINAAYLASRTQNWAEATQGLYALWCQLELNQIYRTDNFSLFRIALSWLSRTIFGERKNAAARSNFLLDTKPLRDLLEREVDFSKIDQNFTDPQLHGFNVSAVHYGTGTTVSFFHASCKAQPWLRSSRMGIRADLTAEHIMASAAIPIFFPPIEIDSEFFGDGSLRQTTPLSPAIHMGADRILAISIRHEVKQEIFVKNKENAAPHHPPALAQIGGELMHSMFMDSLDADLERVKRINDGISKTQKEWKENPFGELRNIPVLVLSPSRPIDEVIPPLLKFFPANLRFLFRGLGVSGQQGNALMSYLAFLNECVQPVMELGYRDTLARKEEIVEFFKNSGTLLE